MAPCKDCSFRRLGCHNVKNCRAWAAFQASQELRRVNEAVRRDLDGNFARRSKSITGKMPQKSKGEYS